MTISKLKRFQKLSLEPSVQMLLPTMEKYLSTVVLLPLPANEAASKRTTRRVRVPATVQVWERLF